MSLRDEVITAARGWLGTPYVWGGESAAEGGVDCSGLIIASFKSAGAALSGRPIASQLGRMGAPVGSLAEAKPADVIYYDNPGPTDHVALYIGGGQQIEAPYAGQPVRVSQVGRFTSIRNLAGEDTGGGSVWGTGVGLGVGTFLGGMSGNASGGAATGASAGNAVGTAVSSFANWQSDALGIGLKIGATVGALALVVIGAKQTVSKE